MSGEAPLKIVASSEITQNRSRSGQWNSRLEFATKHFAIISAFCVISIGSLVITGLYGYLSVFDKDSIQVIEYTDISKIVLLLVVLLPSAIYYIEWGLDEAAKFVFLKENAVLERRFFILLISSLMTIDVLSDQRSDNSYPEYHTYKWLIIFMGLFFAYIILSEVQEPRMTPKKIISFLLPALVTIGAIGHFMGVRVRDYYPSDEKVVTKTAEYQNSKVILLLSHHLIFSTVTETIIIPTSELIGIVKMKSKGSK